ncbi:hypothetical protein TorRG33x02_108920, partial [Trema orientale]
KGKKVQKWRRERKGVRVSRATRSGWQQGQAYWSSVCLWCIVHLQHILFGPRVQPRLGPIHSRHGFCVQRHWRGSQSPIRRHNLQMTSLARSGEVEWALCGPRGWGRTRLHGLLLHVGRGYWTD